jgi:hypothetical protein
MNAFIWVETGFDKDFSKLNLSRPALVERQTPFAVEAETQYRETGKKR